LRLDIEKARREGERFMPNFLSLRLPLLAAMFVADLPAGCDNGGPIAGPFS
jgi:hypothetical protein